MRVAGVQADLAWEEPEANFQRIGPEIARAAAAGAKLVALPEMFSTGFSLAAERIAEEPGGPGERFLRTAAREHDVVVAGSVATRQASGGRPRNLGIVAFPDGSVRHYPKIHPFTYGGESEHYDAGDAPLTFRFGGLSISLLICYDLRFPELFAALAPATDLFVVVASWPEPRRHHWSALLQARSIECLAYVMGVNRVGTGGGLAYAGDSVLWGPGGELVVQMEKPAPGLLLGDVEAERVFESRRLFPALQDRRPDVYRRVGPEPAP